MVGVLCHTSGYPILLANHYLYLHHITITGYNVTFLDLKVNVRH